MNEQMKSVQDYYGKILKKSEDLKTNACCLSTDMPTEIREILKGIHPEVLDKFYGCGSPVPQEIEDNTILDLGSGSGRDCFLFSKLVGERGKVIGVDMTDEQLDTAKKHIEYHRSLFGYKAPNVEFKKGYIEDLKSLGIENESIDVVTSNCVINLSPFKEKVFQEIYRVLRPGGELFFSDVFSSRRIPQNLVNDPVLFGECLSGALYLEDFRRIMNRVGFLDFRMMSQSPITIQNKEIEKKLGPIEFYSITVRAFKVDLEDRCEDYGQTARYLGTVNGHPHFLIFDDHHLFETHKNIPVCKNTAKMILDSRYSKHFKIDGEGLVHFGLFNCNEGTTLSNSNKPAIVSSCC